MEHVCWVAPVRAAILVVFALLAVTGCATRRDTGVIDPVVTDPDGATSDLDSGTNNPPDTVVGTAEAVTFCATEDDRGSDCDQYVSDPTGADCPDRVLCYLSGFNTSLQDDMVTCMAGRACPETSSTCYYQLNGDNDPTESRTACLTRFLECEGQGGVTWDAEDCSTLPTVLAAASQTVIKTCVTTEPCASVFTCVQGAVADNWDESCL